MQTVKTKKTHTRKLKEETGTSSKYWKTHTLEKNRKSSPEIDRNQNIPPAKFNKRHTLKQKKKHTFK